MNCEYVKQNAVLLVYDELADDLRFEMERHVERCGACAAEIESARNFKRVMSALDGAQPEPSANLLAASRMRLQEALETAEQHRGLGRFTFDFAGWTHAMRFSPALATLIFIFGFAGGTMATWRIAQNARGGGSVGIAADTSTASIAGISSIEPRPDGKSVEIKYDRVLHEQAAGSLGDPQIQQLLLYAAHNNLNSGVRMESVGLLAQNTADARVRETLIYTLRNETNPGARLKAIEALRPYVKDDAHVRDAVLEAVMSDASPGVRTEAIHALEPARADGSVRRVLSELAQNDRNQYIRHKAQEVLNSTTID